MSVSSYNMLRGDDVELAALPKRGRFKRNKSAKELPRSTSGRIEDLWTDFVATALANRDIVNDVQADIHLVAFYQAESTDQIQVLNKRFSSIAGLRRFTTALTQPSPKMRLILLPDFSEFDLARLVQQSELDKIFVAQLRLLAAIVVSFEYGVDECPLDIFLRLAGLNSTVSGAGQILDVLSSLQSPANSHPIWKLRSINATAPPMKFKSDLALYSSTFHTEPPARTSIKVCEGRRSSQIASVTDFIVTCNDTAMSSAILDKFNSGTLDIGNIPSNDPRLVLLLLQALSDQRIVKSVASIAEGVFDAKFLVRRDPSWQKMNLLLHLQDHLEDVQECLSTRLWTTPQRQPTNAAISTPATLSNSPGHNSQHPEIRFKLQKTTQTLQAEIEKIHDTLKDQLASKDSTKNKLIAVLAAIYLPFTLASGVLGMNVKGLADGSTQNWSLYLAIGLPLAVATVALPLSFERTYHGIRRFGTRNPAALRILVRFVIPGFVVLVIAVMVTVVMIEVTKK